MSGSASNWELSGSPPVTDAFDPACDTHANVCPSKCVRFIFDVSFQLIADPEERRYFMSLPTSLALPPEAIDRIRRVAGELLNASPEFNEFLQDLNRR